MCLGSFHLGRGGLRVVGVLVQEAVRVVRCSQWLYQVNVGGLRKRSYGHFWFGMEGYWQFRCGV